jgi:hypothetical protein
MRGPPDRGWASCSYVGFFAPPRAIFPIGLRSVEMTLRLAFGRTDVLLVHEIEKGSETMTFRDAKGFRCGPAVAANSRCQSAPSR